MIVVALTPRQDTRPIANRVQGRQASQELVHEANVLALLVRLQGGAVAPIKGVLHAPQKLGKFGEQLRHLRAGRRSSEHGRIRASLREV